MNNTKTVEIMVGLFMLGAIAAFLMLALKVSGLVGFSEEQTGYKITAEFENIGNLKVRAKVATGGVMIGRVVSITLDPQTFNAKVEMIIEQDMHLPIDTRASILTAGLLGDNYIGLSPGLDDQNILKAGGNITIANTDSALLLEKLVARLVAGFSDSMDRHPASTDAVVPAVHH